MSHELLDLLNVRHDHVLCLEGTAPGHLNPRLHDRLNLLRVFNMQTVSRSLPHLWRFPYLGFSGISPSRCVRAAGALETAAVPPYRPSFVGMADGGAGGAPTGRAGPGIAP